MYYLYYDEAGTLLTVSNSNNEVGNYIEISYETFTDLNEGNLNFHDFIVVENQLIKKQAQPDQEESSKIFLANTKKPNCIHITQQKDCWKISHNLDETTKLTLKSMENYTKLIYVVDKGNHNILHETIIVPVKDCLDKDLFIPKNTNSTHVRLTCRSSLEEYIHIQE